MDIGSIVRVGTVDSVNTGKKTARVRFEDLDNMVSGDLPVLQHPAIVTVTEEGNYAGPHTAELSAWVPALGQKVVCLYVPIDDGDGYILGVLP